MKLFRWKAIVPLLLAALLLTVFWVFYVDGVIRRGVEFVGTELVGAKVELASARLRLSQADLVLEGLQVTDPNAPMTNLVEVPEIVADLSGRALLDKKAVIETLAVRGVRFGTPRRRSGALPDLPPTAGLVTRRITGWADAIPVPTLDLEGLAGTVVEVGRVSADSLRSLRQARAAQATADSLRGAWEAGLRGLEPQPLIDSARALLTRLQTMDMRRANAARLGAAANDARTMARRLGAAKTQVTALKGSVDTGVTAMRRLVTGLDSARRADYAYARGLLNIPTLEGPDISMALFGRMIVERLKPVLYWVNLAEQHVPPGLDPRRRSGPKRLRRPGTTYTFPKERTWPAFLLEHADADLAIGGATVAAGSYALRLDGATTEPAVYGRPMTFMASRRSDVGPRDIRVGGMMDRVGRVARDSIEVRLPGAALPEVEIPAARARLDLGSGLVELSLARTGRELDGVYRVTSDSVRWIRQGAGDSAAAAARIGSREWAEGLLWRSISTVRGVTVAARISGELTSPRIAIASNVGDAVSSNLRQALGQEIQRAEAEARKQVDRLVNEQLGRARTQAQQLESQVAQRLGVQQEQLAQLEREINAQAQRLTRGVQLPGGIRLP